MLDQEKDGSESLTSASGVTALVVEAVETIQGFDALREGWRALSARDPEATVFLSWDWLAQAFRDRPRAWRVFVARDAADPTRLLGILPLRLRVHWSREREEFSTEMEAGGRLLHSEYTGFLCDPDHEAATLAALARAVAARPWSELSLRYVCATARAAQFAAAFPETEFRLIWKDYFINKGATDNLLCPRVALPESYETYLQTGPSTNTRQKIRRFTRRHLGTGEWRITLTYRDSFERDREILLRHWQGKWAQSKGAAQAEKVAENYRRILTVAQGMGCLHLPVLWKGDQPLGALGHVLDHDMDRMHFIVAGRDTESDAPSVGLLLHTESMRWGIENGFATYDFGHGNEAYKYSFGAKDTRVGYFALRRRKLPKGGTLDRLILPEAMARVSEMIGAGKAERAQQACAQLARLV